LTRQKAPDIHINAFAVNPGKRLDKTTGIPPIDFHYYPSLAVKKCNHNQCPADHATNVPEGGPLGKVKSNHCLHPFLVKFRHCQNDFFAPLNAQAVRLGAGQVVSYNLSVHHQWQLKEPGAFWVQAHSLISDFCV
jgi:hypothetical protein